MIFKLFVKDLGDRVLHIAKHESNWKGSYITKVGRVRRVTILSVLCDNNRYLAELVGTLETDRHTKVIAIKDSGSRYIDIAKIYETIEEEIITREMLSLIERGNEEEEIHHMEAG